MAVEVNTRTTYPFTAATLVVVTFPDGSRAVGSGAMVGPNDVLTATHVIYSPDRGGWASSIKIYPGADFNGTTGVIEDAPYVIEGFRSQVDGWPNEVFAQGSNTTFSYEESQYDVAVIGLSKAVGAQTGWFELAQGYDTAQWSNVLGYSSGMTGLMNGKAWVTRDASTSVYVAVDRPDTDLLGPGSSGSPLYVIGSGGLPSIIGVKSGGTAVTNVWADIGLLYDKLLAAISRNDSLLNGVYLYKSIPDADATAGRSFSFSLGGSFFKSSNAGETLSYTATLADGSALPAWLQLDAAKGIFSGVPTSTDGASIHVRITAHGANSASASDEFQILVGAAGINFTGESGKERIIAQSGNDLIDGGNGTDTVVFASNRAAYEITATATGITVKDVAGTGGADRLVNIERVQFADKLLAFDVNGHAGQAYRLYQAALNRTPDPGGLGAQINGLDSGISLLQISQNFIDSAEFRVLYGNDLSDAGFVNLLYANVLHRAPDTAGYAVQVSALNSGMSRAQLLLNFSESNENYNATIVGIQNGIDYIPIA
jgi:V8-like Glu-specific endopeptidase